MSHIFEALQRSDAERSGRRESAELTGTELLERVEREAAQQRESHRSSAEVPEAAPVIDHRGGEVGSLVAAPLEIDASEVTARERVFSQFQRLEAAISPESHLVSGTNSVTDRESPAAEAFHLLGVRLWHLRKEHPFKKLLITSTVPQEGKSFVAANLACTLASRSEEKILLLEGDLRMRSQGQLFGLTEKAGICECIESERRLTECIYRVDGPNLWILPAGSTKGNPLDVMQSPELPLLIEKAADWFDWVIIDSPPVLPLADTTIWARLADAILLVARSGKTKKQKLQLGLEALEPGKLIGTLLNSSKTSTENDYYYYRHSQICVHTGDDSSSSSA